MVKEHSQLVVVVMAVLDLAVTAAAWVLCYYLRFHTNLVSYVELRPPPLGYVLPAMVVTLVLAVLVFGQMGLYRPRRIDTLAAEFRQILQACVLVWLLEVVISYFTQKPRLSAVLQTMYLAVWPLLLMTYRGGARLLLRQARRRGANARFAAIVGAGRLGQKLLHTFRRQPWTGYRVAYFIEDRRAGGEFLGVPVRGPLEAVDHILAEHPVDAVFVALPEGRSALLAEVLNRLSTGTADVHVVPDLLGYQFLRHRARQIGDLPVIDLTESPQAGFGGLLKRAMDLGLGTVMLVILAPWMALIAVLVRLSGRGPILYRQQRASLEGRTFTMFKFRSMTADAETGGAVWGALPNDSRVTGVGRFLRRLSLDELPQLLNVLRGDMSLVGPRPERPEFIRRFSHQIPRYMLLHHVKAGLTGWAQVHGFRGRTDLRKRIQYDLDYINRWSLALDAWILVRTLFRGFINPKD